jgi:hypothetical protein
MSTFENISVMQRLLLTVLGFMSMSVCTCTSIKAIIVWVLLPFKMFIHDSNLYNIPHKS